MHMSDDYLKENLMSDRSDRVMPRLGRRSFGRIQEFIARHDLGKKITNGKGLSEAEVIGLLKDALLALDTDIYTLGIAAIRALTGSKPLELLCTDRGEIVCYNSVAIGNGLQKILHKMVSKEHYKSAEEVLHDLNSLTNSEQQGTTQTGTLFCSRL